MNASNIKIHVASFKEGYVSQPKSIPTHQYYDYVWYIYLTLGDFVWYT